MNLTTDKLILVSLLIILYISAFSIFGNEKKLIYIESDTQSLNIQESTISFSGNVILTYEKFKIFSDKIIVTRLNNKRGKEIIKSYGNPSAFCQTQDNHQIVEGYSKKMCYDLEKNFVVFIENACFKKNHNSIKGNKITYFVKEQKIQAYSNKKKDKRVTTILVPSQLKNKNKNR